VSPKSLTPGQRKLRASIAANTRWSRDDPVAGTEAARLAWYQRFVDQVDPDRSLSEHVRERKAQAAMRAHMARLALASSKARSKRAET
jgi:hypothetical protein